MRRLIFILLLVGCSSCAGQVTSLPQTATPAPTPSAQTPSPQTPTARAASTAAPLPPPEGWTLYPSPSADDPALLCANHSTREWRVEAEGEGVKVSPDTRQNHIDPLPPEITSRNVAAGNKGDRHVLRVDDGWLVGLNVGEFGGALWWFSSDGKSGKNLGGEPIVGLAQSSRGVLALSGLAHMGSDVGRVLLVTGGEGGDRRVEALADLGSAPRVFASESQDSLLVLTRRGLVRVRASGAVEELLPTNYSLLFPNSMTLSPSGVVHVGMRHFITRLTPSGSGYKEEWFVPAGCAKFETRDFDCVCVPGRK